MKASTRVVFNTGVLYAKLIIGFAIGLFTTRLVLDALGETDYGIFTLVAGTVGMLGVLQSSMASTSMRFMAHSLGSGDFENIQKTFNTTLFLHFIIGLIVVIIMEVGGLLMFEYILNIPEGRLWDAKFVFHCMVATTFVTIIAVPYDAVINAHENILALSLVDLLGIFLRLGIAIYLTYSDANLLVLYGFLMLATQIVLRIIKQWYSRRKYDECKINFRKRLDKTLLKSILSFSGWSFVGSIAGTFVTQIKGVVLNMFFGVTLNAAYGVSQKAGNQVNMVAASMTRALNPQLVKSEGGGDRKRMLRLTEVATKYSVFLFAIFALPVIIEANYLLNLWLTNVPEYSVVFIQLLLITSLLSKLSFEITSALKAVGKIRSFQITETLIILLNIPIAFLAFNIGHPPYTLFIIGLFSTLFVFISRLYFGKKVAGMNVQLFLKNGIYPVLVPVFLTVVIALIPLFILPEGFLRLIIITQLSLVMMTVSFWYIGVKKDEAEKFKQIINSLLDKSKLLLKKAE